MAFQKRHLIAALFSKFNLLWCFFQSAWQNWLFFPLFFLQTVVTWGSLISRETPAQIMWILCCGAILTNVNTERSLTVDLTLLTTCFHIFITLFGLSDYFKVGRHHVSLADSVCTWIISTTESSFWKAPKRWESHLSIHTVYCMFIFMQLFIALKVCESFYIVTVPHLKFMRVADSK